MFPQNTAALQRSGRFVVRYPPVPCPSSGAAYSVGWTSVPLPLERTNRGLGSISISIQPLAGLALFSTWSARAKSF